jgi:hypothetical protein
MGVNKFKLKNHHTWKSKPGHSICVLDRGAVRFDYPSKWIVEAADGAVMLHDRPPSVESCDLGVSLFRMPGALIADLEMEQSYVDAEQNRDARFRVAIARGPVICVISMNYWSDRAGELEPVWEEVLRTLTLGIDVKDPTAGPLVQ